MSRKNGKEGLQKLPKAQGRSPGFAVSRANAGPGRSREMITRISPTHRYRLPPLPLGHAVGGGMRTPRQLLPGCLLRRGAVSVAWLLGGSGSHPAPSASCAGLGPWIKHNIDSDSWAGFLCCVLSIVKSLQVTPSLYKCVGGSLAVVISGMLRDKVVKGCFLEVRMKF